MGAPPVRVVFCHYTSDVCGGSDRALYDLVAHLDRSRFTPFMLLKTGDPMIAAYEALGLDVYTLPFASPRRALEWRKLLAFFGWFWPHTIRAALQIRRWNADVVHVNTSNNLQGGFAARLAGKPLVWHVRELVPGSRVAALMRSLVSLLATRAVAISTAVAESLNVPAPRLRIIFDGINLAPYLEAPAADARAALELAADTPVVACIGRLEPWKGQDVLVEAVPSMVAARPDLQVLLVGGAATNKPEFEVSLRERCNTLGVAAHVTFTGIRSDVPDILKAANVLVLPSITPEPFGLTIVEAMAAGCPVVATAAGGPLDTVEDGVTGRLVPPGDPASLSAAVLAIIEDPAASDPMGRAGRERALARYGIERLVGDMSALFDELAPAAK